MALLACYVPRVSNSEGSYISVRKNSQWRLVERQIGKSKEQSQFFSRTEYLVRLAGQMCDFLKLNEGWNSYGSTPPSKEAISRASGFLSGLSLAPFMPSGVAPSAEGGIAVRFKAGERRALVEFLNDGDTDVLLYDTEARVEAAPDLISSNEELLTIIESHLLR